MSNAYGDFATLMLRLCEPFDAVRNRRVMVLLLLGASDLLTVFGLWAYVGIALAYVIAAGVRRMAFCAARSVRRSVNERCSAVNMSHLMTRADKHWHAIQSYLYVRMLCTYIAVAVGRHSDALGGITHVCLSSRLLTPPATCRA